MERLASIIITWDGRHDSAVEVENKLANLGVACNLLSTSENSCNITKYLFSNLLLFVTPQALFRFNFCDSLQFSSHYIPVFSVPHLMPSCAIKKLTTSKRPLVAATLSGVSPELQCFPCLSKLMLAPCFSSSLAMGTLLLEAAQWRALKPLTV